MIMKRFIVFRYDCYYPSGGMNDVVKDFDEATDAIHYLENTRNDYDYSQVFDRLSGKIIHKVKGDIDDD